MKKKLVRDTLIVAMIMIYVDRTSYYALCLISKTPRGAEVLMEHNWTTVCHSMGEKWPLAFHEIPSYQDTPVLSPGVSSTKASTPLKSPSLHGQPLQSCISGPIHHVRGSSERKRFSPVSVMHFHYFLTR